MSVLIKNMEMPKDGVYWCEIGVAGDIAMITIHGEDRKSFSLVPVPPHGRLIDEHEILKNQHDVILKNGAKHRCFDTTLLSEIPAIIEAEEEQE